MIIKFDIEKTYDKISWSAILTILEKMNFSLIWITLIKNCISSSWFSFLVNGSSSEWSRNGCGICQGDPISPYLFIFVTQVLSNLLNSYMLAGDLDGFRLSPTTSICHLMYADDVFIVAKASVANCNIIMSVFEEYRRFTNQKVNISKSSFYLSTWCDHATRASIRASLGIKQGFFPFAYLGVDLSPHNLRRKN